MRAKNVIVFSAAFGAGHIRAAEAIIEEIRRQDSEIEIIHLDYGLFINENLYTLLKITYLGLIKYAPKIWGKFYYRTANILPDSTFQSFLNNLGRNKILPHIKSIDPSLVVCTYPIVSGVIAQLKTEVLTDVPLVTVITDYTVHSQWIHEGVDLYIVGCKDVHKDLLDRGIDASRIQTTGIPVNTGFEMDLDRQAIIKKLELQPNVPTILIMCGAFGVFKDIKAICEFYANIEMPVQSIIVCGKDEKLYKSLNEVVKNAKNTMKIYGFINNVEELMAASDVIITKAGGLTVSESLSKQLPLVIYKPIPGQEEKNALFLVKNECALIANNQIEIKEITHNILKYPQKIKKMQHATSITSFRRSAESAVKSMLRMAAK